MRLDTSFHIVTITRLYHVAGDRLIDPGEKNPIFWVKFSRKKIIENSNKNGKRDTSDAFVFFDTLFTILKQTFSNKKEYIMYTPEVYSIGTWIVST